ncbi:hypothetical protein NHQ30_008430 [Ciborinia camelliae]|nr:hypothetical protein NHQ30_008430 [Ciborinia camelliae]
MTLTDLPPELILNVGRFLPRKSIGMLALCSSSLYENCVAMLFSDITVNSRTKLQQLIKLILARPVIGSSIRSLQLHYFYDNDLCRPCTWETNEVDLFNYALSVQNNKSSWNSFYQRDFSTWALIAVLLCLVPGLKILALPALETRELIPTLQMGLHADDYYLNLFPRRQPEVHMFIEFIALVTEDRPDRPHLSVLTMVEKVRIGARPGFITKLNDAMPFIGLKSAKVFRGYGIYHFDRMIDSRIVCPAPIPNIKILTLESASIRTGLVSFLNRFNSVETFKFTEGSKSLEMFNFTEEYFFTRSHQHQDIDVEDILEGLIHSKNSLESLTTRCLLHHEPKEGFLPFSRFQHLQLAILNPTPSRWWNASEMSSPRRLINEFPAKLKVLTIFPPFRNSTDEKISFEQFHEVVKQKEKYAPDLQRITCITISPHVYECINCSSKCELAKIPFLLELMKECRAKDIYFETDHNPGPHIPIAAPQQSTNSIEGENNLG